MREKERGRENLKYAYTPEISAKADRLLTKLKGINNKYFLSQAL